MLCHFVLLCASPHSLWTLLQPIWSPAAWPDTNIIPLWHHEARSSRQAACLTSRFFLFHRGGSSFGKIVLQDQHEVDSHLVYSAENPQMANTTHSLGSVSQQIQQPAPTTNQAGQPNSRPAAPDQTREIRSNKRSHVCGKLARLFKQRGDSLCSLLFIAAFI